MDRDLRVYLIERFDHAQECDKSCDFDRQNARFGKDELLCRR